MLQPQQRNRLFVFIAATIVLVALAATLPTMHFESGEPFPFSGLPTAAVELGGEQSGRFVWLVVLIFWVGLSFSIIYMLISPEGRKVLLRLLPVVIVLLGFMQLFGNRKLKPVGREVQRQGAGQISISEFTVPPTPEFVTDPPNWLLLGANVIIGLLLLGAMWLGWRWYRHRQEDDSQAMIVREAERTLADLEAGGDLKSSIMRCYADMSRVLQQEKHVHRHHGMTVREFETQLASIGLADQHVQRLTRLFELVRYSPNTPGERDEREAVDCLHAIVRAYGESV